MGVCGWVGAAGRRAARFLAENKENQKNESLFDSIMFGKSSLCC